MAPPTTAPALDRRPALAAALAARGARPAVVADGAVVRYDQLAAGVDDVARRLGPVRRLVLVEARNDLAALTGYLGALAGGHAVLLAGPGAPLAALRQAHDPDVALLADGLEEAREGTRHVLHPELALLLGTSGSTGSPKLVRLSRTNLLSNAHAVVEALGITAADRAVTTLPLQHCYGLSVVHSHLLAGASLVLTGASVADADFPELLAATGTTTLPGVPHTFALLERTGLAPRLAELGVRTLTQAGGRMEPERVRRFAGLPGVDLHVMYGATEATARMAVLPTALAATRPEAVGLPVPGSAFRLEDLGDGSAELVFTGPGVMMGYAESPADLARGPELTELRTGDLGRQADDGLWEVVGRRARIAKPFGVRVDLDHAERLLAEPVRADRPGSASGETWCVDGGDVLVVAVEGAPGSAELRRLRLRAAGVCGLSPTGVRAVALPVLPRTASGKPDRAAVLRTLSPAETPGEGVAALYARVLERSEVGEDDTFVGLGGDSLSYVEASVRLEQLLGSLPDGWHRLPVRELEGRRQRPTSEPVAAADSRWSAARRALAGAAHPVRADLPLLLRALAIVLVVAAHSDVLELRGGAHLLLAVAGFNLARFQGARAAGRARAVLQSTVRVVAPSVTWIAGAVVLLGWYPWHSALLLNWAVGPERLGRPWELWFLEALVLALLVVGLLLAVPAVDRFERRHPFGSALAVLLAALVVREVVRLQPGAVRVYGVLAVGWLVALGWAAARASTVRQRALVSALTVAAVPGFFAEAPRGAVVVAGVLALLWVPTVRLPAALVRVCAVLAAASLYVYLAHWQVFPQLELRSPVLALLASFAAGLAYQQVWERGRAAVLRRTARSSR